MAETTIRTLVCSVMFLDIVDYSKRSVGDQQHMKQTFNELLARALEPVPPRDFIVLDTGDGAAIAFLGDPEDALSAGIAVRKSIASLPPEMLSARMGINLGQVRLVWDINAQMNILGDGINDSAGLKAADVGISVDTAVDIAKESADIILLEKNLGVLGDGVIEGRKVFGNITKYIKMGASSNFGNMFSVVGASIHPAVPADGADPGADQQSAL